MNFRIAAAREMLTGLNIHSALDVGCRDSAARDILAADTEYFGCDLFQNPAGTVTYVGDIMSLTLDRHFDCVIALDVVEHVDDPHALMDRLVAITDKHLLVSLPNIFDLRHKLMFMFRNTLGGKYQFGVENTLDRHRWVMNHDEILAFLSHFAEKHDMRLSTRNLRVGLDSGNVKWRLVLPLLRPLIDEKTLTSTVVALLSKQDIDAR